MNNSNNTPVRFIGQDFRIPFYSTELNHRYSAVYIIEKEGRIETLEKSFSIRRLRSEVKQDDYHFIEIDKISKLLINGKSPKTTPYKVAEKTSELLYPLQIVVDKWGKWVELNSYIQLKEHWEKSKADLKDTYDSNFYEMLVEKIENALIDKNSLIKLISGDWFLRAFFNGIHTAYTRNFETEKVLFFPAIAEIEDLQFSITQKVEPYLNDLNQIVVTQIGVSESDYLDENYEASYFLNPDSYLIEQIKIECEFKDMHQKITLQVRNLDESTIEVS